MTIREILATYNGSVRRQIDEMEFQKRIMFNAHRLAIYFSLVTNPNVKNKPRRPEDVLPFDWDEGVKIEPPSKEMWNEWNNMKMFPDTI